MGFPSQVQHLVPTGPKIAFDKPISPHYATTDSSSGGLMPQNPVYNLYKSKVILVCS